MPQGARRAQMNETTVSVLAPGFVRSVALRILARQGDTTAVRRFGPLGIRLETPCNFPASQGEAWPQGEMCEYFSQPQGFEFRGIRDSDHVGPAYHARVATDHGAGFALRPPEGCYWGLSAVQEKPGLALPEQDDPE
eukprot:2123040-Alexandrium_andersonii.AAC.1